MVSQVSGRFPIAKVGGICRGKAPRSKVKREEGADHLRFHRSASGPRKSKARRKPTPTTSNWRSQMTLIKSLLLGSAAGIVAVASAQAADLPTRKAAPVEYVKVCNVGGITGWTLPGSDTCVKFIGLHHRAVRGRQPQHPVQLGLDLELTTTTAATVLVPIGWRTVPVPSARLSRRVSPAPAHRYRGGPELPLQLQSTSAS